MATYKVIQDIEAEDKLIGPLSLRQFIYAIVMLAILFVGYTIATIPQVIYLKIGLALPFLFPAMLFGFLASPFGHDQTSEVWLLAKIRFILKPRIRIWDQNGMKELVTILVPKKIERIYTDGMTQLEVKSRLKALANTIDSRGWAVKNADVNIYSPPSYLAGQTSSDRLVSPTSNTQEVPLFNDASFVDVLDEQNSVTAQNYGKLVASSQDYHRQQAVSAMNGQKETSLPSPTDGQPNNNWFVSPAPASPSTTLPQHQSFSPAPASPSTTLPQHQSVSPAPASPSTNVENKPQAAWPTPPNPAIIGLVNNNDLNVATIARQAGKISEQSSGDEVTISLR